MPEHRHGLPPLGPKAGSPKHDGDGGLRSRSRRPPTTAARAARVGAHPSSSLPGGITGALSVPVSPPPQGRPPFGNPSQRGAHSGCTRPATCAEQDGYALAHVASNAGLANHQWLPTGGPPARPGTLQAPPVATGGGTMAASILNTHFWNMYCMLYIYSTYTTVSKKRFDTIAMFTVSACDRQCPSIGFTK